MRINVYIFILLNFCFAFLHLEFIISFTLGILLKSSLNFFLALTSMEFILLGESWFMSLMSSLNFRFAALHRWVASSSRVNSLDNSSLMNVTQRLRFLFFLGVVRIGVIEDDEGCWGNNELTGEIESKVNADGGPLFMTGWDSASDGIFAMMEVVTTGGKLWDGLILAPGKECDSCGIDNTYDCFKRVISINHVLCIGIFINDFITS